MQLKDGARSVERGASTFDAAEVTAFLEQNPELQYVDCVFADLCGVVRGKRIARDALIGVFEQGLAIPTTIYFLDARGDMVDALSPGGARREQDGVAWPVAGALTRVNWSQRPHAQVLMTLCDAQGRPYFGEPRNVLERVVGRFDSLGLVPQIGCAFEFYLFDRERAKDGAPQPPAPPADAPTAVYGISDVDRFDAVITGVVEAADTQGLPPLATVSEGTGRFRIAFDPTDAVRAGDHAVFLRQIVRAVARKRGLDATFMAKPFLALPGSAMALTIGLEDGAGRDMFADRTAKSASEALLAALGGLQAVMADSIALFAPNANAYRRFRAGGAARNKRWGFNNPTTALNVTGGAGLRRRIEHRVPGADANPYLAIAAALAGAHHGMSGGLDPGQPFDGDAARFVDQTMPFAIDAALVALENGSILREYLGPTYIDLYCATKRGELERFRNHIPAHEYDWYL